ncbi:hypothetical protein HRF87_05430 [Bacillus sp. CRN 9]|nr:hypothetical protein [Bacillus sp. CRN 9]
MYKNQRKWLKTISILISSAIVITTFLTPLTSLSKNVVHAQMATSAPMYQAPSSPKEVFTQFTGGNSYIFYAEIDGDYLHVDMTKVYKNYGMKVTMPNGRVITEMKTQERNSPYWLYVDILPTDGVKRGSYIKIETLNPSGKVIYNLDYIFPKYYHGGYDSVFGQDVYNLFKTSTFDTINESVTQDSIDNLKRKAANVPENDEKTRLVNLIGKAQELLNQKNQEENNAKTKVENLFKDLSFNSLKDTTNQQAIDEAKDAVTKLPAGSEKDRLEQLLNIAQDLLNKKEQDEKDVADAKKKVEDLFTNDKFDILNDTVNQQAIDEAKDAVAKLPAGPEKDRLEQLLNKAQDLLNKKEQDEKDVADAKKKVEDLFTNDKFDILNDTVNQQAIDEAKDAVAKLPAGPEKDRLEQLLNKAQDLLNKKEQEEKDVADAKKKVEDLFTNDKFDILKDTVNQQAIDEANEVVAKLPAGPEKDRLEQLLNKAQDLLNKKEQDEKDVADAKKKVEDLFTNDKFDILKDTVNQQTIDEAQDAVNKLPASSEKNRLQELVDRAKELYKKDVTAPEAPKVEAVTTASNKVTGTGEAGATVTVAIGGKTYDGKVGADGRYSLDIPRQPVNTEIRVTLTDEAGNRSNTTSVKVSLYIPNQPVEINPVYKNALAVTGQAPEGATIVRLLVNGIAIRMADVNDDGTFSIYSRFVGVDENGKNKVLIPGDIVTVDYGIRTPANIQAHTVVITQIVKPTVNSVAPSADYVTGKAPAGTHVLRLTVNGVTQRTVFTIPSGAGHILPDGSFQIYSRFIVDENGNSRRLQSGDVVEVDYGAQVPGDHATKVIVK